MVDLYRDTTLVRFFLDGVQSGADQAIAPGDLQILSSIGNYNDGHLHFPLTNGMIAEILIFDKALSTGERQSIEQYLNLKYGLGLGTANTAVDTLTGGAGNDTFTWDKNSWSGIGAGNRDIITDFKQNGDADKIDLSDFNFAGVGAFIGNGAFSGAAEVRWVQSGADTVLELDTDGDTAVDFEIQLNNFTGATLAAADFVW